MIESISGTFLQRRKLLKEIPQHKPITILKLRDEEMFLEGRWKTQRPDEV